ncbi:hypothetical protein LCGC14_3023490, partial [marine sediment metagenome]
MGLLEQAQGGRQERLRRIVQLEAWLSALKGEATVGQTGAGGGVTAAPELSRAGPLTDQRVLPHRLQVWRLLPGRGRRTTILVDRYTASGIECVTKAMVFSVRAQSLSSCSFKWSRTISSSAPKGSSISRISASKDSARAIEARCCIPPESCH